MSKKEGRNFEVTPNSVDEYSFDLDLDGESYEGGSYLIKGNGDIVNVAITPNEVYGNINQLDENKEAKPTTKMKKSDLKANDSQKLAKTMSNPPIWSHWPSILSVCALVFL